MTDEPVNLNDDYADAARFDFDVSRIVRSLVRAGDFEAAGEHEKSLISYTEASVFVSELAGALAQRTALLTARRIADVIAHGQKRCDDLHKHYADELARYVAQQRESEAAVRAGTASENLNPGESGEDSLILTGVKRKRPAEEDATGIVFEITPLSDVQPPTDTVMLSGR